MEGKFIVIEGIDGTGKTTQLDLLQKNLKRAGYDVAIFDFPQYDSDSSYFVKKYLNGEYGSLDEMGPEKSSLFFAMDRYDVGQQIEQALSEGKVVLANRYVASNLAHQGSKIESDEDRKLYYTWDEALEFDILEIPEPDVNIILTLDPNLAMLLAKQKEAREGLDLDKDIHENDVNHLHRSASVYQELGSLSRQRFAFVNCSSIDGIQSKETISQKVIEVLSALEREGFRSRAAAKPQTQYLDMSGDVPFITAAGHDYLEEIITNTSDDVYAFTGKMDPVTIAAAMARLSRRGDDMRVTLLDEFVGRAGKDADLLKRVITAYGDDSVQQLTGLHVVVENASNLLTKKLEWGRLAAYLEQSTRYIYFDQKNADGNYKYYTPTNLDEKTTTQYQQTLDEIFDKYSSIVHKLTDHVRDNSSTPDEERDGAWKGATRAQACDAARPLLPVATTATVGIFASGQALESLIMRLRADQLDEAKVTGNKLLREARKVISTFLERADKPDRGGATSAYMASTKNAIRELADDKLPAHSTDHEAVRLVDVTHRNEIELVPYMLYEQSALSLAEIEAEVETWSYEQKLDVFQRYVGERLNRRHKPGRALEHLHYTWDLICDYGIFRDLQRHRIVDGLEWQLLTPRYGYDIPQLVEDAGLTDEFEECFDLSYELYSRLQALGLYDEAQYATLMGHKMRWKIMYNARQAFHFHELRTSPQGHPGYRKLVNDMHEHISAIHPNIAGAMRFVNKGEDPELTRLAAEKYTQFKLEQLDS